MKKRLKAHTCHCQFPRYTSRAKMHLWAFKFSNFLGYTPDPRYQGGMERDGKVRGGEGKQTAPPHIKFWLHLCRCRFFSVGVLLRSTFHRSNIRQESEVIAHLSFGTTIQYMICTNHLPGSVQISRKLGMFNKLVICNRLSHFIYGHKVIICNEENIHQTKQK